MILEREEGERERKMSICYSTFLYIRGLFLVYAWTRDWTRNLGVLGQHSNQLSYPARETGRIFFFKVKMKTKYTTYILKAFIHVFIQQIFAEHLCHVRCRCDARFRGYSVNEVNVVSALK